MNDYLISMFIDDELDLDQKIELVETIDQDSSYAAEAVGLLEQEKLLRAPMVERVPAIEFCPPRPAPRRLFAWLAGFNPVSGLAGALAALLLMVLLTTGDEVPTRPEEVHRFVIYRPETSRAEIVGSFTGWQPLPMHRAGSDGYWSISVPLPAGEHRYSFVLDQGPPIADPTVVSREADDFGGENSIIRI